MKIELTNTEIAEIISKYTDKSFDENDIINGVVTENAIREALLCGYEVIHKEDMIGQSWSWYERLRKTEN